LSAPRIYVAYSGGADSHVLLHLCAHCPPLREKLCALHIHHGLQNEADDWLKHCEAAASALGVAFLSRHVDAKSQPGQSPEETARNARYRAFAEILNAGDVMLSAQHRDDQMETLLLQLFRGAGLAGLAAMPRQAACGKGLLLRPLLDTPRADILAYAQAQRLQWVEDPSNAKHDYDRNYLRHAVVPLLKQRWPGVDKTVARAARHCANAQMLLEATAEDLLQKMFDASDNTLNMEGMRMLDRYRQQLLLRQWFKTLQRKMPAETVIERIIDEIVNAPAGRYPELSLRGGSVRRYRNKLYWVEGGEHIAGSEPLFWPAEQQILELPGNGRLQRVVSAAPGLDPELWTKGRVTVRYRQGGERLRLPGRDGTRELKKFFQERGVAPWDRDRMPLLYIAEKLAAVGELWTSADFYRSGYDANAQILWLRR
jgi:tRNA(Ile)-lysidine synthase